MESNGKECIHPDQSNIKNTQLQDIQSERKCEKFFSLGDKKFILRLLLLLFIFLLKK